MKCIFILLPYILGFSNAAASWFTEDVKDYMQYAMISVSYDFESCIPSSTRRLQTFVPTQARNSLLNESVSTISAAMGATAVTAIEVGADDKNLLMTFDTGDKMEFTYKSYLNMDTAVVSRSLQSDMETITSLATALQGLPCVASVGIAPSPEGSSSARTPEFIRFAKPPSKPELSEIFSLPSYPNDPLVDHMWWYSTYAKLLKDYPSEANSIINSRIQDVHQIWNGGSTGYKILAAENYLNKNYDQMNENGESALWVNEGENGGPWTGEYGSTCNDGIDNDANGYIDDCLGPIAYVDGPTHGTISIGLITGITNNDYAIASACPGCKAVPVGFFNVFTSVDYAIATNSKILHMAFVYWRPEFYKTHPIFVAFLRQFVKQIQDSLVLYEKLTDGLIVSAAGNVPLNLDDCTSEFFPTDPIECKTGPFGFPCSLGAELPNMVCVGSADKFGKPWQYSTYGRRTVSVFAPGANIEVLWDESTSTRSGSSMSTAIVSGVAGLVRSRFPDLTARQVKSILLASCKKGDGLEFMCECGGVVDAVNAMALATVCTVDPVNCGKPLDSKILEAKDPDSIMKWFCDLAAKYGHHKVPFCSR